MGALVVAFAEGPLASVQPAIYTKAAPIRYTSVPNGRRGNGVGK